MKKLDFSTSENGGTLYLEFYRANGTRLSFGLALSSSATSKAWIWDSANNTTYWSLT